MTSKEGDLHSLLISIYNLNNKTYPFKVLIRRIRWYSFEKRKERYTYADYLSWPDGERWEIIAGEPYSMSPAPSRQHQQILGALFAKFYYYLEDKACRVYPAPFDVRLFQENDKHDEIDTVVQPDIVVVCDDKKLDDKGCQGAPDLIIEIISQSTAKKDLNRSLTCMSVAGERILGCLPLGKKP